MAGAAPDRHFNAEARAIDAMVWIDGVEVPFNSITIQIQMDAPSVVSISIEPDEIIDAWRPKSWVHVWVRDPFADAARVPHDGESPAEADQRDLDYDLDTYNLFWEGEVVAIRDMENAESRETIVEAHDLWNIPMNANINLVEIGAGLKTAFINGSTFFGDVFGDGGQTQSFVTLGIINYLFTDGDEPYSRDATKPSKLNEGITLMGKQVLKYLSQFNASYGFQAWRTDFLEKFTGIPDSALKNFLRLALAKDIAGVSQSIQPSDNVLGYMHQIIAKFYHHFVTILLPSPAQEGQDRRRQVWNEFAVIPNLYYAFPPMCNWLFPEHYVSRDVGRSFMEEPTRLGVSSVMSTGAGFRMMHLAPEGLIEFLERQSNASIENTGNDATSLPRIHGSIDKDVAAKTESDIEFDKRGFYVDNTVDDPVNLLRYMTPEELEKGILYRESQNAYQELLGLGRLNLDADDAEKARSEIQKRLDQNDSYLGFMRLLAQFELNFKQVSRGASVSGVFNPWPVVGLPMLICREGRSYKGLLTAISHQISYSGQASTSYQLSYTQLFRPKSLRERSGFQKAQTALEEAARIRASEFRAVIDDLVSRGLLSEEEAATLRAENTNLGDLQAALLRLNDRADEGDGDFSEFEASYKRLRTNASSFPAYFGITAWDNFDEYAGYCFGLLGLNFAKPSIPLGNRTGVAPDAPDPASEGNQDGDDVPSATQAVLQDQYGGDSGISSPWKNISELLPDDVGNFWLDVARPLRLAFEDIRDLVKRAIAAGSNEDPDVLYVVDPDDELTLLTQAQDIEEQIRELEFQRTEEVQRLAEEGLKREVLRAETEELFVEVDPELPVARRNAIEQFNAEVRQELDTIDAGIAAIAAEAQAINADYDVRILGLRSKINKLPEGVGWRWTDTMDSAFQVFLTQSEGLSTTAFLDRMLVTQARIPFYEGPGPVLTQNITWTQLATLRDEQAASRTLQRIRANLEEFAANAAEYLPLFGISDIGGLSFTTVFEQIVNTFKEATAFTFETRSDRFNRDFNDPIEDINTNYKVFKQFLQEAQLELPPLMPFSNGSMIDVTTYDETVQNMIVPREDIGKYGFWSDNLRPAFSTQATARTSRQFSALRQEVVLRYDEFVRMARKIFPFNEEDSGTEYQAQSKQGTAASWANRVQARRGITMREFQDRYGLKVESRSASDPDTFGKGTYYIAVAEFAVLQDNDFNSFFSKLGRITATTGTSPQRDPLFASINEMREVARNGSSPDWEFIKASVRQGIIEEYTRRHAVARAFRGKR